MSTGKVACETATKKTVATPVSHVSQVSEILRACSDNTTTATAHSVPDRSDRVSEMHCAGTAESSARFPVGERASSGVPSRTGSSSYDFRLLLSLIEKGC